MTQLNLPHFGKKNRPTPSAPDIRSNILARIALKDLLAFHEALDAQIREMLVDAQTRLPLDNELLDALLAAQAGYVKVMRGFSENSAALQRNVLIAFADAVQDIMICYNRRRRH